MKNIIIAGAGLAGLSCAYHLKKPYFLFDKEDQPGGLSRSYEKEGYTFDYTGHLLHLHNPYTKKLIKKLLQGCYVECQRNAWIYSKNVYTRYPFQANLFGLPRHVIKDCIDGLRDSHKKYGIENPKNLHFLNFRDWCVRTFGKGISKHFMIPYNEKLWGVPGTTMSAEWCGPFVPKPRLEEVIAGSFSDQQKSFGYNPAFLYPKKGGIQSLANAMTPHVQNLQLNISLEKVRWKEQQIHLSNGQTQTYAHLVSTLPLVELLKRLDPFPHDIQSAFDQLRWSSILCINIGVQRPHISDKSWIYFPEKKYPFYRVGFPMNFTPSVAPKGTSSMYVEVSCRPGACMTSSHEQTHLFRQIRRGLISCGVIKRTDQFPVIDFIPIPYAYVIYDASRRAALTQIFNWLHRKARISSIGRYGAWKYSFMEEALLDGKKTADTLNSQKLL